VWRVTRLGERYGSVLTRRYRLVVVAALVLTAVVGAGAVVGESGQGEIGQFETDSPEQAALDRIEAEYPTDEGTVAQVVVRGENVLSRASLLEGLRLQQVVRTNPVTADTLREEGAVVGLENVVGSAAARADGAGAAPTLAEQVAALERRDAAEVRSVVERVLDPSAETPGDPYQFLPSDYEPGATTADARITFVFQTGDDAAVQDAQLALEDRVTERFDDAFVFGQGIVDDASTRAVGDSFAIITPVALVLVLLALGLAYRDVLDVLVGVVGIAAVMAWLAGIQGWLGVPSSQLLIAVPFLLIGLSIDYSLHVVMRYREAREGDLRGDDGATGRRGPTAAMRLGTASVVFALGAATVSTGVGFLSNYVSPLAAVRDFAVLSAGGIFATFVVFTTLVPALKLGVERLLAARGRERRLPAVGVGAGRIRGALTGAAGVARRAPVAVVLVALLLAAGGAAGATDVDTEFNRADFLPEDPPAWTDSLPGPLAPGDYDVREDAAYLGDNFRQRGEGAEAQILLTDGVTDPATLDALAAVTAAGDPESAVVTRADGTAAITGPHTLLRDLAAEHDRIAEAVAERDTDGDGLPDEDVAAVYDAAHEVAPEQTAQVLARDGGTYTSARLVVGVQGDAAAQTVAADVRAVADSVAADAPVTAVATGGPVVTAVIQDALLTTLVESFAVTLVVILTFLVGLYWWRHGAPALGAVALVPVLVALAWLLGTMAALGLNFNSETAVITSLAIGLGADYSIHLTDRFVEERAAAGGVTEALTAAVRGTGGALLGSATTTAAGFGVLALALSPPLQRFGTVTGLAIAYAFLSCLTVLPSLFVLRERVLARRTESAEQ
jgi:predicted RND superfamily exporter protein